ncbi:hypothetical protein VPH35_073196 [Triticum aestivum]
MTPPPPQPPVPPRFRRHHKLAGSLPDRPAQPPPQPPPLPPFVPTTSSAALRRADHLCCDPLPQSPQQPPAPLHSNTTCPPLRPELHLVLTQPAAQPSSAPPSSHPAMRKLSSSASSAWKSRPSGMATSYLATACEQGATSQLRWASPSAAVNAPAPLLGRSPVCLAVAVRRYRAR